MIFHRPSTSCTTSCPTSQDAAVASSTSVSSGSATGQYGWGTNTAAGLCRLICACRESRAPGTETGMRWIITASQYPPRVTNVPMTAATHLPPSPLSPLPPPLPHPCLPPPLRAAIPVQSLCVCERVVTPGSMFRLVPPCLFIPFSCRPGARHYQPPASGVNTDGFGNTGLLLVPASPPRDGTC